MKRLLLLRHGKSSWEAPGVADRERPLKPRGLRDAPLIGQLLAARGVRVDAIVSSPAARARATAERAGAELGFEGAQIRLEERIYEATPADLLEVAWSLEPEAGCALFVGHNPGMLDLANAWGTRVDELPTCGLVDLFFSAERWVDVGNAVPGVFAGLDVPRRLRDLGRAARGEV